MLCMLVRIVGMAVSSINAERNLVFFIITLLTGLSKFICCSVRSTINIEYIDYSDDRFILIHGFSFVLELVAMCKSSSYLNCKVLAVQPQWLYTEQPQS